MGSKRGRFEVGLGSVFSSNPCPQKPSTSVPRRTYASCNHPAISKYFSHPSRPKNFFQSRGPKPKNPHIAAQALTISFLLILPTITHAAPPVLDALNPAGAQRGTTTTVTAAGKLDKWPVQVWADTPAIKFEPAKTAGVFTVTVSPDAPLGPHLIRIHSPEGASALRCFIVGDHREIAEIEPNDELTAAQPATQPTTKPTTLPVTINAQLDKAADIDCYAANLKAGQTLVASVQGRRLGSPIDPLLHLLDEAGNEIAFAHDGLGLDPLLVYTVPRDGRYTVRLAAFAHPPAAEIRFTGGKNAAYRLTLTTRPFVYGAIPAGVQRGRKSTLTLLGWNLSADKLEVDATAARPHDDHLFINLPGDQGRLRLDLTDFPELIDAASANAMSTLTPPLNVSGVISASREQDRFTLSLKKGQRFNLAVKAATAGSPLDPVLRLEDSTGKTIYNEDDSSGSGADPRIEWTIPADGAYTAIVADRFAKGGPDHRYRLEIQPPKPEVQATIDADTFTLTPGKSVAIKLTLTRRSGHDAPLVAVATGLPPGVTATSADVPAKANQATLTLTAAPDAKPASTPIRILLLTPDPTNPQVTAATYDLHKDKEKAGPPEFFQRSPDLWLTVLPPPPATAPSTAPTTKKSK